MIIYIILLVSLFSISILFSLFKNRFLNRILPLFLCMTVVLALCVFKSDNIGMDTQNYHGIYEIIKATDFKDLIKKGFEIGFSFLMKIVSSINPSFLFFNCIFYIIVWLFFSIFALAYAKNPSFCFATIVVFILQFSLSAYRQTIAAATVALGMALYKLIKNKIGGIIALSLSIALSCTFHIAALIAVLVVVGIVILKFIKINYYVLLGLFIVAVVGVRFVYLIVTSAVNLDYAPFSNNIIPLTAIMSLGVLSLGYFLNLKQLHNVEDDKQHKVFSLLASEELLLEDKYFNQSLLFTFVGAVMMTFALTTTIISRLFVFFVASQSFVISETISSRKRVFTTYVGYIVVAIVLIAYFCVSLVRSGYYGAFVPYETVF